MDRRSVEIVLSAAKHLSFFAAAEELFLSTSTVSKQISKLEIELGIRIFHRSGRSQVTLTDMGQQLLQHFRRIEDEYRALDACIARQRDHDSGMLTFYAPMSIGGIGEAEVIASFCRQFPSINVKQLQFAYQKPAQLMENKELDLAFFLLSPSQLHYPAELGKLNCLSAEKKIAILPIQMCHLFIAVKNGHPAIRDGRIDLKRLEDCTFLFREFHPEMEKSQKLQTFIGACEREGFVPKLKFVQSMRTSTVMQMVAADLGVAALTRIPKESYAGVTILPTSRYYYHYIIAVGYRKENRSIALQEFIDFVKENCIHTEQPSFEA